MVEDTILMWRFKHGSRDALARIYNKYEAHLLTLATALLNDISAAEDIVHDFFVSFAKSGDKLRLDGNLKGYLAISVANRARDYMREKQRHSNSRDRYQTGKLNIKGPDVYAVLDEELRLLTRSLDQLPYDQREILMLYFYSGLKFREIAGMQNLSINTVQSRYRYGLEKLRVLLNGELKK
ncbi:MAG: sigma-70 family RNA polymerase sigma factor [Sedimentisphaerales bacterium]|nr:sigma-70 family RNA polymerase sigma factor [Sedimentisphaerales bacterium]